MESITSPFVKDDLLLLITFTIATTLDYRKESRCFIFDDVLLGARIVDIMTREIKVCVFDSSVI